MRISQIDKDEKYLMKYERSIIVPSKMNVNYIKDSFNMGMFYRLKVSFNMGTFSDS